MPATFVPASANVTAAVTLPTTVETVIATLTMANPPSAGLTARLMAVAKITAGTGTTAITLRIRRGSLTGALVGPALGTSAIAGNTLDMVNGGEDAPGEVVNQVYVLTAQQTAATAGGSALMIEFWGAWF